ncbi:type IV pilus biogenesis protein PilM [Chloroflexota bacterium]
MITLEISSTSIRLMETEGEKVVKWASNPLEPGIMEGEVVSNPEALSAAIKELMNTSGINGNIITASVSGLYSLSRIILVPAHASGRLTPQTVREKAEEVIPLPEEEIYLSWQSIAPVEGEHQVLVVGVPRDVINSEMQAFRMAGISARLLDLKALALARAVNRKQALILNIEPTSFDTVVVINGITVIMRTTAWQPGNLSVEDKAEHLAVALELTVGFHNSHNPSLPIDRTIPLFITGEMSGDTALLENLQVRAGYPVEPLAPPLEYPEDMPVSQYAVNIGLALKGAAASKNMEPDEYPLPDFNLLPQAYQPWKLTPRQVCFACAVVAALALLIPIIQVNSDARAETNTLKARYNIINTELQKRQAILAQREPLQKAINYYQTIVDKGGGFTENLMVINSEAEKLGIEVKSINHEGNLITVSCQADSYLDFRDYVAALKESGRFSSVSSPPERYSYVQSGTITLTPKPAK